jgi:glycerol-3-phosphate acyltransferase PlsX
MIRRKRSKAQLTIALDVMGGDRAPEIVLKGANIARERYPNCHFLLYGDEAKMQALLARLPRLQKNSTICHTDVAIPSDMKPSQAVRLGRASSMAQAIQAVKDGKADAIVSAGNTGALMALSKMILGMVAGIKRPAIASYFPTKRGESIMLDLGANIDCTAQHLEQFAIMGHVFAQTAFHWEKPSIGLLNVGAEEQKGREEIRDAAAALEKNSALNYYGFVEGNDIAAGTVDVIVADGFTGNVALKTAEGTASLISEFIRQTFRASIVASLGYLLAKRAFSKLRVRIDPRRYNGAVLIGLNGISVKSHGGTDTFGFASAIDVAVDMVANDGIARLREHFAPAEVTEATPLITPETV